MTYNVWLIIVNVDRARLIKKYIFYVLSNFLVVHSLEYVEEVTHVHVMIVKNDLKNDR